MTDISIDPDFDEAFYEGVGTTGDISRLWDVALNGRGYMLDTNHPAFGGQSAYLGRMGIDTIPLIRQQADTSSEPGEATINPEDLWPRAQSSWHKGAGQRYLDAHDSDRARFRSSKGIDPWTRGQLNMLHDTSTAFSSASINQAVLRVGGYIYYADGNTLKWATTPLGTYTDAVIQNGEAAQSIKSIASDGFNVYAALGSNGVHKTTRGAGTSTHYSDLSCTLLGYTKGRLMAANGNAIYNIIAAGVAPSALFTHPNTDFTWVGFAEGTGQIYAAGYSGDKSLIYRTAVKADGTSLDAPVVAGELPDGEIVRSIVGYLGFVVIGTDIGFRLATQSGGGDLTIGALVRTATPVRASEPQDRFVWFGWDNYDAGSTGLGRIDLTIENDDGTPAYASDLMATAQGNVTSVITEPGGTRMFTVAGVGLFYETATNVATATIDSGLISFGIPDSKIALRTNLKHKPLVAGDAVNVYVTPDDGGITYIGTSDEVGAVSPDAPFKVPELAAQLFEVELRLSGAAIVEAYDFRAYPAASRGRNILVPILLHEKVITANGSTVSVDVLSEYEAIESLVGTRRLISYQELGSTYSVFVEETNFQRHHAMADRSWWNGTLLLKLKVLGD